MKILKKLHAWYNRSFLDYLLLSIYPYRLIFIFYIFLVFLLMTAQGCEIIEMSASLYKGRTFLGYAGLTLVAFYSLMFIGSNIYSFCRELEKHSSNIFHSNEEYDFIELYKYQYWVRVFLIGFVPILYFGLCLVYGRSLFLLGATLITVYTIYNLFSDFDKFIDDEMLKMQAAYRAKFVDLIPEIEKKKVDLIDIKRDLKKVKKIYNVKVEDKPKRSEIPILFKKSKLLKKTIENDPRSIKELAEEITRLKSNKTRKYNQIYKQKMELSLPKTQLLDRLKLKLGDSNAFNQTQGISFVLFFITILFFLFNPTTTILSSIFGPLLALIIGLFFILNIIFIVYSKGKQLKIPLIALIVLWIAFCTFFNNNHILCGLSKNHTSDHQDNSADSLWNKRLSLDSYIEEWIKLKDYKSRDNKIFLVAAEGGGIRAGYWTTSVLTELNKNEKFRDRLFCMSGVSGGSIGIATFNATQSIEKEDQDSIIDNIYKADLITPTITGFLFPEIVQKFIPYPILTFDRTHRLENTWANSVSKNGAKNDLDLGFIETRKTPDSPIILYNTTTVETGRKSILSNIKIEKNPFDADDVIERMEDDIPIKSAAMASARFPFITPPATIIREGVDTMNIVDGGYFDNSGLHSVFQIVKFINGNKIYSDTLIPVIIYIKNSRETSTTTSNFLLETKAPLKTFVNSWDAKDKSFYPELESYQDIFNFELYKIELDKEFPLAWSLSESTQKEMKEKINGLGCVEIKNTLDEKYSDSENVDTLNSYALKMIENYSR